MFVPSRLWSSQWSCMVVRAGPKRRQKARELMLLNCGAREDSWESLDSWEIKPVNFKGNQPWILIGRTDAEDEAPVFWSPDAKSTDWENSWCWERLRAEGEEGIRGWDDWMVSQMQWTWTWANFWRWWGTGRPGMLQSRGSQSWTWLGSGTTTSLCWFLPNINVNQP